MRTRRGEQAVVEISGKNSRRVLHGAMNVVTGAIVRVVRERSKGADCGMCMDVLAQHCDPEKPHLLVWDNAPPHWTHAARDVAPANLTIAWLPFRSLELMPCEDVWRELTRVVAWLDDHTPENLLHLSGLLSSKFDWLPT